MEWCASLCVHVCILQEGVQKNPVRTSQNILSFRKCTYKTKKQTNKKLESRLHLKYLRGIVYMTFT